MSKTLFASDNESDQDDLQLNTNKEYAKHYNYLRKKELYKKFKDRGYDVSESDGSSDTGSSDEDDDAAVVDSQFDKEFFKTLASLKSKDPAIYDKNTKFFEDATGPQVKGDDDDEEEEDEGGNAQASAAKSKKPSKPLTLKDYERQVILEKGGKFVDDDDEDDDDSAAVGKKQRKNPFGNAQRPSSPTVVEEERRLREEFKKVMNAQGDSEDEEFGGIFKKREKTQAELDKEEEDFTAWLAGKKKDIEDEVKSKLEPLKHYWSKEDLPQSERFLRDYILNKGYANAKASEIPTYDEIVGEDPIPLSEDEQELEKQIEFEHKYNFRYEEPDTEFIKRYPRTIENSVRRKDDTRKQKREELKKRKQEEKQQKMKEIEMIKEMKRREIEEKIQKLKLVTGNEELGIRDDELEEDFDPEAHDRRMRELFNDEYYQVDEGEEKPEVPSDIDELKVEDWDNFDPERMPDNGEDGDFEPHCEDDDFNMDCDYDPAAAKEQLQKELIENTKSRKKRRGRRNRFMEMIQAEKPPFNPEDEKTYGEYIDEYYKLDCEDIIDDIPCRFKYVETTPNDFGLTIEEILLAKNKELNQWASLKKAIQIRPEKLEKQEQRLYKMKAKNEELKRKIFKSLYGEGSDEETEGPARSNNSEPPKDAAKGVGEAADAAVVASGNKAKRRKRKSQAQLPSESAELKEENTNQESAPKVPKLEGTSKNTATAAETAASGGDSAETKKKRKRKKNKTNMAPPEPADQTTAPSAVQPQAQESHEDKPSSSATPAAPVAPVTVKPKNRRKKKKANSQPASEPATKGETPKATASTGHSAKTPPKGPGKAKKDKANNVKDGADKSKDLKGVQKSKQKFKPKFKVKSQDGNSKISDERLKAYGINPRKFHKKQKYNNKQGNQ